MNFRYIIFGTCFVFAGLMHGSEQKITIELLQKHDIPATLQLVQENIHVLCDLPGNQTDKEQKIERCLNNAKLCFNNNIPMSSVQRLEGSFARFILKRDETVEGLVEFCLQDNNNGYIEGLCSTKQNSNYNKMLILYAISNLEKKNVNTISTHILTNDNDSIELHQALGFVKLEQTQQEKECGVQRYRYNNIAH